MTTPPGSPAGREAGNDIVLTPSPPPDPRDAAAARLLDQYASTELSRVRTRADKWTAGLAALVTVVATATVIKGPDSIEGLDESARYGVVCIVVIAGVLLGVGVYWAYQAAVGSPTKRSSLDHLASQQRNLEGLADDWRDAVNELISESRDSLASATHATVMAAVLIAGAIILTWLAPRSSDAAKPVCFESTSGVVAIEGPLPTVTKGNVQVVACPKD